MDIKIFGTEQCTNCKEVLKYLDSKDISYEYNIVGKDILHEDLNNLVGRFVRSVPVILMNDSEIKFEELKEKISQTDLELSLSSISL